MDSEALQKLVKEKPRVRCLLCLNLHQDVVQYPNNYSLVFTKCIKGLDMPGCGRNFNPRGGNAVPA